MDTLMELMNITFAAWERRMVKKKGAQDDR